MNCFAVKNYIICQQVFVKYNLKTGRNTGYRHFSRTIPHPTNDSQPPIFRDKEISVQFVDVICANLILQSIKLSQHYWRSFFEPKNVDCSLSAFLLDGLEEKRVKIGLKQAK